MNTLIALIAALALAGCSTVGQQGEEAADGGAVYNYHKTGDDCATSVTSSRSVTHMVVVVKGCDMAIEAGADPSQKTSIKAIDALGSLGGIL